MLPSGASVPPMMTERDEAREATDVDDELIEDELIIEEISIDGMCGVY
jgi:mycofactocin precursor